MTYKIDKKEIRIPDGDIDRLMSSMQIEKEEAIQIWLEDEGYEVNEEQEELCQKAKENKSHKIIKAEKAPITFKAKKKVVKENPVKEEIIKNLFAALESIDLYSNVKIENKTKIITFTIEEREFKIDLIEKRKKKGE